VGWVVDHRNAKFRIEQLRLAPEAISAIF